MNGYSVVVDKQALVEIYERHSPKIFRYAYRMFDDKDLAEDCVADTFLRLLIAVWGGISPDNVRAYLYRIAHNWITDYIRRRPPPQISLEEESHSNPERNLSNLVTEELDWQRIRAALLRLTAEQRQVIELRFIENWSHNDVAIAVGKTVEATRALQYRAVEALLIVFIVLGLLFGGMELTVHAAGTSLPFDFASKLKSSGELKKSSVQVCDLKSRYMCKSAP